MTTEDLKRYIDQGRGIVPADLVIKNCRHYDLVSGDLIETDIAICGNRIVGTFGDYSGTTELDGSGQIAVPGFIDTHLHIESSLVTPLEFDRCVLPHGVTTAICDPHELSNVIGVEAIRYFLACAEASIMDIRVNLSSCVPATTFETAGAALNVADLIALRDHPKVLGLAEFMNFPGVLAGDPDCLDKLHAFQDGHIDGHSPQLVGKDLNGYLSAGIRTDHEATTAEEALEKLKKGMAILIREGSVSRDLAALTPLITERLSPFIALCTDDRNPLDIAESGHLDYMIRTAIANGADRLAAYRAASISAARIFGLKDRGLVAPGLRADIVLLEDLDLCAPGQVISGGQIVSEKLFGSRSDITPVGRNSVKANHVEGRDFRIDGEAQETSVIGVIPGKIITDHLRRALPSLEGVLLPDVQQDVAKVAVVERHGRNGNIGLGFVHGFGLQGGAIGSTVGHDSHNICVVGMSDEDMALATNRLGEIEGGFVVVRDGVVLAELRLPIAGLMSLDPFETVRDDLLDLRTAARSLGTKLDEPFLQVAFLPLPVIPHLKITDMGLFDVDKFELIRPQTGRNV